jgi:predicted Rossmann fold nucleotide-binding protein DprA/Smf involved in DNA uptake
MIVISFTGVSRKLDQTDRLWIADTIGKLKSGDVFLSGAAEGVDVWAAECAITQFPEARHEVVIPAWLNDGGISLPCPYDVDGVKGLSKLASENQVELAIRLGPPGADHADGYMLRNDELAHGCTHLVAFPEGSKEQRRSGTWSTVRRARKLNRPVKVAPLADAAKG